ncbi:amino acid ABC transporter permease (plasmid) [Erwinia rhapontici]|uniref:amino acid ABC transporter permease n=1 Tax=Erwinia rhapontici TaxID=55212 RepID=UPI0014386D39|nr:amino acid ABC transporter permease [Erwinia rhapontici]NKG29377.1 amino acid ABC transporter permease [Erwinia rhapontici]
MSDVDRLFISPEKRADPAPQKQITSDADLLIRLEQEQGIAQAFPLGRWLLGVLTLLIAGWLALQAADNQAFDWPLVRQYLFHPQILAGLWTTLWLTLLVTFLSMVFGVLIAVMRLSANPVISLLAWCYIWLFRATPLLVQLLFWFNIGYLVPKLNIGLPGLPPLWSIPTNDLISALGASILGLTLHGVAHSAEFIRGGLLGVPKGQQEAARMLGLSSGQIFRKIVFPQSLRTIIPALGNFLIDNLKGTSIISVVAVTELLYSAQLIYNRNYKIIPLLMVATLWYVFITSLLSLGQSWTEKYYSRGYRRVVKNSLTGRKKP